MIKRRFYKQEHGDKDVPSDSSSSSDSELDADASIDREEEEDELVVQSTKKDRPCSSSSGYESEDSSGNEVSLDSSGLPKNDDGSGDENYKQDISHKHLDMANTHNTAVVKDAITIDILDCVLKSKSVFKCKLCPRVVCLTEETLKAHLKSKRHSRSEKLLREGRLKMMLNSDGEIEGEGETHQERHASTLALAESTKKVAQNSKKNRGRQRQRERKRLKMKTSDDLTVKKTKKPNKKRRKSDT